jgi:hypothetical protein
MADAQGMHCIVVTIGGGLCEPFKGFSVVAWELLTFVKHDPIVKPVSGDRVFEAWNL